MTSFVAIDFETADTASDSACSIGMVKVKHGKIVAEFMRLIRPPRRNIQFSHIHGLTWEDLKNSPTFGELWPEINDFIQDADYLVAHNSSFDRNVLLGCCAAHSIPTPKHSFECTVQVARKVFGIYPTKLSNVSKVLGIELNHHEALSDARAAAQIMILAQAKSLHPTSMSF